MLASYSICYYVCIVESNKGKRMEKENKLIYGDRQFIAESLKCSQKSVEYIVTGARGKRDTPLQRIVKDVINFREKQNEEMERYCLAKQMEMKRVSTNH